MTLTSIIYAGTDHAPCAKTALLLLVAAWVWRSHQLMAFCWPSSRPSAVDLGPVIGVDLELWPTNRILAPKKIFVCFIRLWAANPSIPAISHVLPTCSTPAAAVILSSRPCVRPYVYHFAAVRTNSLGHSTTSPNKKLYTVHILKNGVNTSAPLLLIIRLHIGPCHWSRNNIQINYHQQQPTVRPTSSAYARILIRQQSLDVTTSQYIRQHSSRR